MWDLGGQEVLRAAWNTYYTNTEFVIIVIDSTDRERLLLTKVGSFARARTFGRGTVRRNKFFYFRLG